MGTCAGSDGCCVWLALYLYMNMYVRIATINGTFYCFKIGWHQLKNTNINIILWRVKCKLYMPLWTNLPAQSYCSQQFPSVPGLMVHCFPNGGPAHIGDTHAGKPLWQMHDLHLPTFHDSPWLWMVPSLSTHGPISLREINNYIIQVFNNNQNLFLMEYLHQWISIIIVRFMLPNVHTHTPTHPPTHPPTHLPTYPPTHLPTYPRYPDTQIPRYPPTHIPSVHTQLLYTFVYGANQRQLLYPVYTPNYPHTQLPTYPTTQIPNYVPSVHTPNLTDRVCVDTTIVLLSSLFFRISLVGNTETSGVKLCIFA